MEYGLGIISKQEKGSSRSTIMYSSTIKSE